MTAEDVFRRITAAFDRANIPYMLSGPFAGAYYGDARSTQDIDFVIEATPAKLEALKHDGLQLGAEWKCAFRKSQLSRINNGHARSVPIADS
jgi:hypothetical protein